MYKLETADHFPRSVWPPELTELRPRRLADGRKVIPGRALAGLLQCSPDNLRRMATTKGLARERDLDESTRSWYRLEEVARAYLSKYPDRAAWPEEPEEDETQYLPERWRKPLVKSEAPPLPPAPAQLADPPAPDDRDALIRQLTEENKRLRSALMDPARKRHPLRRHGFKD